MQSVQLGSIPWNHTHSSFMDAPSHIRVFRGCRLLLSLAKLRNIPNRTDPRLRRLHTAFDALHGACAHRICNEKRQEHGEVKAGSFELHDRIICFRRVSLCWLSRSVLQRSYTRLGSPIDVIKRSHASTHAVCQIKYNQLFA